MKTFKRHKGLIPPLKRKFEVRSVLFFDTETRALDITDSIQHLELRLGYAIYQEFNRDLKPVVRLVLPFDTPGAFVDLLKKVALTLHPTYVIAHNLQFDIQVLDLPRRLHESGFSSSLPLISPWSFVWNAEYALHKFIFFDSLNIFQVSLEKLGESIGLEKRQYDERGMSDAELSAYCLRDVEILEKAFTQYFRFLSENNLGYFCTTIAWQAMTAYRTRFMEKQIHVHTDKNVLKLERRALHGGRNECFFIGQAADEMWFSIDINSMYSYIMRTFPMPVRLLDYALVPSRREFEEATSRYHVIARVQIESDQAFYPATVENQFLFPVGRFTTTLHSAELEVARAQGHIHKILEMAVYERDWIFDSYVDFFYDGKTEARKKGDKTTTTMMKLFLNSLYGKFAQEQTITEHLGKSHFSQSFSMACLDLTSGLHWTEWHWFGDRYLTIHKGEKPYTFPAITGAIASYARAYLLQFILQAGFENVLYCDTDSLILNFAGIQRLSGYFDEARLGQFKLQDMSDNVRIFGLKDYQFGQTVKFSGLKLGSLQVGENTWEVKQFRSFRRALKVGETGKMELTKVTKHRETHYSKGVYDVKTGRVSAIRLEEW